MSLVQHVLCCLVCVDYREKKRRFPRSFSKAIRRSRGGRAATIANSGLTAPVTIRPTLPPQPWLIDPYYYLLTYALPSCAPINWISSQQPPESYRRKRHGEQFEPSCLHRLISNADTISCRAWIKTYSRSLRATRERYVVGLVAQARICG